MAKANLEIPLTLEQEQVLIGSLLGDGNLTFGGVARTLHTNAYYREEHSIKQKDYLEFKSNIFSNFITHTTTRYKNDRYTGVCFSTSRNPSFTKYYNRWYKTGKKKICFDDIKRLTPLGLAIWYMDDGSYTDSGCLHLYTNGFTLYENKRLVVYFKKKWKIVVKIIPKGKYYYLAMYGDNMRRFKEIIADYIIPTLQYKIRFTAPPPRKFTDEQVKLIRAEYANGCTQKNLGIKYNAPYQAIGAIVRKEIYVDVR